MGMSELPFEIVEKVMCQVAPPDRLALRLVCKFFAKVIEESPRCWFGIALNADAKMIDQVPEMLKSPNMRYVRQLKVVPYTTYDMVDTVDEKLIKAVVDHPGLTLLDLSRINLSEVDPELLAVAVNGVERVNLYQTSLSNQQLDALFTGIIQGSKLRKLLIGDLGMEAVDPELLSRAVNKLQYVSLYWSLLTMEQKKAIFTAITVGTVLKSFKMTEYISFEEDPFLIARAVNKLEEVDLTYSTLSQQELENVLQESLKPDSKLRRLWLKRVSPIEQVDVELLHLVSNKLELYTASASLHHASLPDS